ncbi:MAG: hypothetical protein ABGZ17_27580, partial [Planctomycetaceae bacterium]
VSPVFHGVLSSAEFFDPTGWSDPSPGGNLTRWISTPFTAHSFLTIRKPNHSYAFILRLTHRLAIMGNDQLNADWYATTMGSAGSGLA